MWLSRESAHFNQQFSPLGGHVITPSVRHGPKHRGPAGWHPREGAGRWAQTGEVLQSQKSREPPPHTPGGLISSNAASPRNRWSSCCGHTTKSWGLSTGSTAGSVLEIPHTTCLWWPACSSGVSSKTVLSIMRAFLCPRSTAWWQVSSSILLPILLRKVAFMSQRMFSLCVSQIRLIQQTSTLRSAQSFCVGSCSALWCWPTTSTIRTWSKRRLFTSVEKLSTWHNTRWWHGT